MSFEVILPFLRPIERFILDPEISEVMVNASGRVFIERLGKLEEISGVSLDKKHLEVAVKNIARRLGDDISEEKPLLDSRLPDGSRVAAVFAPCSVGGTTLAIRKFHNRWFSVQELVGLNSLTEDAAQLLTTAVGERRTLLISGGTGTGKTTLLNALASSIPDEERIVLIEDTAEIKLEKPDLVRLEARGERRELPAVTIRDLVKVSLRLRPDRILVGEVRGSEAFDLLQALNTGHSGSLSTIHANSAVQALGKLANYVLLAGVELPYAAIQANIAESVDLVVQVARIGGKRHVTEVVLVDGFDHTSGKFALRTVYKEDSSNNAMSESPSKPPKRSRSLNSPRGARLPLLAADET
jgi:pilus assembly protein CpaF